MKRRRLLFLNAMLAALALLVMTTGGILAFQPPLTALTKIQLLNNNTLNSSTNGGVVAPGGTIHYRIDFSLSQAQQNVRILDTLRGRLDLIPASVATDCPNGVTVQNLLNAPEREDWNFLLGNFAAPTSCSLWLDADVRSNAQIGSKVYNSATVYTSTGWKGIATVGTLVVGDFANGE
ncbi:MAG: hypothetical protein EPO21_22885 [Chloroflexota bacterium]|nr:MAG: hypothetical protein EPO21_22885 [Chloroflexota bacterium]